MGKLTDDILIRGRFSIIKEMLYVSKKGVSPVPRSRVLQQVIELGQDLKKLEKNVMGHDTLNEE